MFFQKMIEHRHLAPDNVYAIPFFKTFPRSLRKFFLKTRMFGKAIRKQYIRNCKFLILLVFALFYLEACHIFSKLSPLFNTVDSFHVKIKHFQAFSRINTPKMNILKDECLFKDVKL